MARKTTTTARLTNVFHDLDRNRDGALSLEEFTPLSKAMRIPEEAVQPIFGHIDTDSNGVISESELLAFFRHRCNDFEAHRCNDFDVMSDDQQQTLDGVFKNLKAHVVDFTKEDLDKFGITDLRSTDFIKASGSYFKPLASTAEILANARLADALMHKTEFTQQEWDAFGVDGLLLATF